MGKASSSKKVTRAARAAGKPGGGRNLGWPALIGSVVVLGVVLIVFSRGKTGDALPPILGDHWHAAYGIYDCDHFISPLTDVVIPDATGVHTHDDGLMHIHPFGTRYTGKGANLGNWGITTGFEVSDSTVKASGISRENGDTCGDKPGTLQLKVWDSISDETGHLIAKDYADYAPQDLTLWTLAFVPEGTDIPKPPAEAIANLQAPADLQPPGASTPSVSVVPSESSSTTAPGTADTTPSSEPPTTVTTSAP